MAKIFNRDIELSGSSRIMKNGSTIISATGRLEAPIQFTASDVILDDNGNEMLGFGVTASAVNYATLTNAAANTGPKLSATGDGTSVPLNLVSKANGVFMKSNIGGTETNAAVFSPTVNAFFAPMTQYTTILTAAAPTDLVYSGTHVLSGIINRSTVGANRSDTLPSATQILNAVSTAFAVGSTVRLRFLNTGTNSVTVNQGGGGTFTGSKVVLGGYSMDTAIVFTNVTAGAEAYTALNLGFGQIA